MAAHAAVCVPGGSRGRALGCTWQRCAVRRGAARQLEMSVIMVLQLAFDEKIAFGRNSSRFVLLE